jgi:hypothetical protein
MFDPRSVNVSLVALGPVFLWGNSVFTCQYRLRVHVAGTRKINGPSSARSEVGELWIEKYFHFLSHLELE